MKQYLDQLEYILTNGEYKSDRTGIGCYSVFGLQTRYDLREGFPLVTTKDMSGVRWRGIVEELLWFLSGDTNNNSLKNKGINIWSDWADSDGELGPIYGHQWRNFGQYIVKQYGDHLYNCMGDAVGIDQISWLIEEIKNNPNSRRLIVSAWNPRQMKDMALPPCHTMFQVFISGEYMDLQLYQRSADFCLGVPYNIASYSLLLSMIAEQADYYPRFFIHTIGDAHVYENHIEGAKEQVKREPHALPQLLIRPGVKDIFSYTLDDFELFGYQHHPSIKFKVAV